MKCANCGFESEQDFAFCAQCGTAVQPTAEQLTVSESTPVNPLYTKTLAALKDPLFLVLCILVTTGAFLGLLADQVPLLLILASVFLWIVYAKSRRDNIHVESLRSISGVVFADYVVSYVVTGLLVVMGVLLTVVIGIAAGSSAIFNEIVDELGLMHAEYIDLLEVVLSASAPLMLLIFLLLAVPVFLFNFFGMRKIHAFVKSLYQALQNGAANVLCAKETKTWLMVLGILSVASALTSLSSLGAGVAMILASVLVGKYFVEN